jgi:hypothetical protein
MPLSRVKSCLWALSDQLPVRSIKQRQQTIMKVMGFEVRTCDMPMPLSRMKSCLLALSAQMRMSITAVLPSPSTDLSAATAAAAAAG